MAVDSHDTFQLPEAETQEEILFEVIAPFLLVYLILQLGLYITFQNMLRVDDKRYPGKKTDKKAARKYSSLMALVISMMVMVSPFFEQIIEFTFLLFGTVTQLVLMGAAFLFLYVIYKGLT